MYLVMIVALQVVVLVLLLVVPVELREDAHHSWFAVDRFFVDDALGLEHIALVAVKTVHGRLERLLNHELLQNDLALAPLLNNFGNKLVFVEVDTKVRLNVPPNKLKDVPWCNNALCRSLILVASASLEYLLLWFGLHVLVHKFTHVKDG